MADDYEIKARIVIDDTASRAGATGVKKQIDGVEQRAQRAGMSISSIFGKALAVAGGIFGMQKLASSVVGVHTEIENAEGAIATLSSALFKMPIDESVGVARNVVQGLNADAAKGVGELKDYTKAFQMLLAPTSAAGANLEQIRQFTRQSLTAGFAMRGVPGLEQAPMDIVQALQSGINERMTPIAARVIEAAGVGADKFNKMNVADKMKALQDGFAMFEEGAELLGQGWDAQTATLKDQLKAIARILTRPLFDRWTQGLRAVNDWLEKNEERIASIATDMGGRLLNTWDHLIEKAATYAAIVAGLAVAEHLPSSLGGKGRSGAGLSGGGGLLQGVTSLAGAAPKGASAAAGGQFATGPQAAMAFVGRLMAGLARVAGPAAIVATIFAGIAGAMEEFPALWGLVAQSGSMLSESMTLLGDSFGHLFEKGSALNLVGAALVGVLFGLATAFNVVVRAVALVVEGVGFLLKALGAMTKMAMASSAMIVALMTGDMELGRQAAADYENFRREGRGQLQGSIERMKGILGLVSENDKDIQAGQEGTAAGMGRGGTLPEVGANGTNIHIGTVQVDARSEINNDPARIAIGWEEVLDDIQRNPRQPRRAPSPLVG